MEGINKLRAMTEWFNSQSEYLTDGMSFKQLERIFDYSVKNELQYMDEDYLFSDNIDIKDREKAIKFLSILRKFK
jgi:hypothetical protein